MDRNTPIPPFGSYEQSSRSPEIRMQRDPRTGSWMNVASDSDVEQDDDASVHLSYLRASVATDEYVNMSLPPSPQSSFQPRPRAPSPLGTNDDLWSPPPNHLRANSTALSANLPMHCRSPLPAGDLDPANMHVERPDSHLIHPFKSSLQPLSSMSISTASSSSTRSSAYGSSTMGPPSDYGQNHPREDNHVRVVLGDDDREHNVGGISVHGITSDDVAQLLSSSASTSRINTVDPRWSYTSTSSSVGRSNSIISHDNPSESCDSNHFDKSWVVEEEVEVEEEYAAISESEATDDDEGYHYDTHLDNGRHEEELTTAVLVAEEGTGQIVQADGIPVNKLNVLPGTTHLLLSSSPTPSLLPPFLLSLLPSICSTLLVLDISANFLLSLPPALALCTSLEELNIASNPLRVLPVFLCELTTLRVLIADATGLSSTPPSGSGSSQQAQSSSFTGLPDCFVELERLHTLSIRRNKLYSLPAWLCKLPALTTLCVDGNPFQGPWKALVDPLLAKVPTTPAYPPSTPTYPTSTPSLSASDETPTDVDDQEFADEMPGTMPTSASRSPFIRSPYMGSPDDTLVEEDQEHTIRAPVLGRAVTTPIPAPASSSRSPLQRTRTAPNRNFISGSRSPGGDRQAEDIKDKPLPSPNTTEKEVRRMKSAGDLRRGLGSMTAIAEDARRQKDSIPESISVPVRQHASTTNLLDMESHAPEVLPEKMTRRFASVGAGSALGGGGSPNKNNGRGNVHSLWDNSSRHTEAQDDPHRVSFAAVTHNGHPPSHSRQPSDYKGRSRSGSKGEKEKTRWGFLKKMSMGKLNGKDSSPPNSRTVTPQKPLPTTRHTSASSISPQIDLRFSMTGTLNGLSPMPALSISPPAPSFQVHKQPSLDALTALKQPSGSNLLAPTSNHSLAPGSPGLRPKRRSYLPIVDNLSVPNSSMFVGEVVLDRDRTPSPLPIAGSPSLGASWSERERIDEFTYREEERMREAYARALRSVMAYLRDMFDLGVTQQPEEIGIRSRRPTILDREGSTLTTSRSGNATLSVATTDSNGSGEEKKCKDDKSKRAMIVKEIVETERTYVKNLAELVDIYIKPATGPVNILSGVSKETVVPAAERKVVFSGIESLFSFHKESFLPALEAVSEPVMVPSEHLREIDTDGMVSLKVAKAVGNMFVKHAAFMRMYSTYINNCDNASQRVKYWTSERPQPAPSPVPSTTTSPSSSTAQLAGFGLAMSAISSPGTVADGSVTAGLPNLTTNQKRRLKSYLKRCRLNPRHSQISLEAYLLLPVQRIPRYRMLLEELSKSAPPTYEYMDDPLDRAVAEISSLAMNMNEGKRESESRRKLVHWQSRIRAKFHSPLVQPHRRLIMDGPLLLTRVVRKAMVPFETINPQGDAATVQVDCLAPELTPRPLVGILCNDLLVLCREATDGAGTEGAVDLWAVLRMQTLPQPASIVHGNSLRLVDSKAILYFDAPSASDALTWFRAINLHIPASQS